MKKAASMNRETPKGFLNELTTSAKDNGLVHKSLAGLNGTSPSMSRKSRKGFEDRTSMLNQIVKNLRTEIPADVVLSAASIGSLGDIALVNPNSTLGRPVSSFAATNLVRDFNTEVEVEFFGAPPHPKEAERLEILRGAELETVPSEPYDVITQLASNITDCPISCISLVEDDRQWFKSHHGTDLEQTPRNQSFCAHAILDRTIFEVEDATQDPRFKGNPLVTGDANIKFYAGVPLQSREGLPLGALCVIDSKPRKLSDAQRINLAIIARQAEAQIQLNTVISHLRSQMGLTERLLCNILPESIVERLRTEEPAEDGAVAIADSFEQTTVLFVDITSFTQYAAKTDPKQLMLTLGHLFAMFDKDSHSWGVTKIKSAGDDYMAVAGVPEQIADHAVRAVKLAFSILESLKQFNIANGTEFSIRIGLNSGPLTAGVVGMDKFTYDCIGDTVNVAKRIESTGVPNKIHISDTTYELVKDHFEIEKRTQLCDLKGKGCMQTYLVHRSTE